MDHALADNPMRRRTRPSGAPRRPVHSARDSTMNSAMMDFADRRAGGTTTFVSASIEASMMPNDRERWRSAAADAFREFAAWTPAVDSARGASELIGSFASATDAVAAVLQLLRVSSGEELGVRVAIHTGDADSRSPDQPFETTVGQCRRLRSCAHPGQVLLSQTSADLVGGRLPDGVGLLDLGRHRRRELFGTDRVHQLVVAGLRNDFPLLASIDSFRHNLASPTTPLIGRQSDLAELAEILVEERLLTLTGSGGCGKSRLALELARQSVERFPGGVAWVELAACSDFGGVVGSIAGVLDIVELPGQQLIDRVVASLGNRQRVLLVLDNAEHVLAAAADAIAAIVVGAPLVTVISTSREPIGLAGEVVWRVPSLSTPPAGDDRPDAASIAGFDAVRLFVERAGRSRRAFALTDANAVAVAQICRRLDGLPLALELAAARVRTTPPEQIAAQLDDRFRLLAGGPRTLVARQQTLQASVAWSEGLLSDTERRVFRRLGVFVGGAGGGFVIEAAEAVVSVFDDVEPYEIAEIVARLVDKSLVQLDDGADRYHLLETIRSFALQRLFDVSETVRARDAHADWCAAWLARVTDDSGATDANAWWEARIGIVDVVGTEWPNCASALDWVEPGSARSLRLVAGLGDYWAVRQSAADSARYGMPALLLADRDGPEWLTALLRLQAVRTNALDLEFGMLRDDAVRRATEYGDRAALLRLEMARLITMIMLVGPTADLVDAVAALRVEAVAAGEWYTAWNAMQGTALVFTAVGRLADSDASVAGLTGARALLIRSTTAELGGDLALSAQLADRARRLGDGRSGAALDRMLMAYRAAGAALLADDCEVLDALDVADVSLHTLPSFFASADAIVRGVRAILDQRWSDAVDVLAAVQPDVVTSWICVAQLAQVQMTIGDQVAARVAAASLVAAYPDVATPLYEATGELVLAECDRDDDLAAAMDRAHRSLAIATSFRLWPAAIDALEAIGSMLVEAGRTKEAARILAACSAARDTIGYRHRYAHRALYVSAALEVVESHDGWSEGAELRLTDAVSLAQRMRGERLRPIAGWESLTPTELQVIEQVVLGLTNAQIAERLLMSRATVKTHLVHVYTKLGIATRAELAAIATRRSAT